MSAPRAQRVRRIKRHSAAFFVEELSESEPPVQWETVGAYESEALAVAHLIAQGWEEHARYHGLFLTSLNGEMSDAR